MAKTNFVQLFVVITHIVPGTQSSRQGYSIYHGICETCQAQHWHLKIVVCGKALFHGQHYCCEIFRVPVRIYQHSFAIDYAYF